MYDCHVRAALDLAVLCRLKRGIILALHIIAIFKSYRERISIVIGTEHYADFSLHFISRT